ncbi:MAG TPA: bifunctional oligoribonuclease/PAP phosphatase NrnA [Verrucomicrobiae bacterium]|jgi:phosphoesterase RecJ-like protein|nr:bifunctional oligoribonuclease/PAP phosphatase NrnA [Verrucomicrobiae bacterium]
MDQLENVLHHIQRRKQFLLTSHARPDGDAVGSVLALAEVLRAMGKSAEVVLSDNVPVIYKPLPFAETIIHSSRVNGKYEAAIILECDSVQRTRIQGLEHHFLISIDHHASYKAFADVNWIDPSASATAEMVYRLATAAGVKITPEMATCLYTAVLTDTGSFAYAPTNAHTFELARQLVEHGADPAKVAQSVYFANPEPKMHLLGAALSSLRREASMSWMTVTRQDMERCKALEEDCEGLVNYALSVAGVEVAVFFRETSDGRVRVSMRSKGALNVAQIAERFGGGGHECASGFSIDGPLPAAGEKVLSLVRARFAQSS